MNFNSVRSHPRMLSDQKINNSMFRVWEKLRGGCFHSLNNFSNCWVFFHTSANLQLPRKSEPPYFCSIPIICPSVSQGKMKGLLSATPYFRERWYWSPQATLGASRIQSQGHVEQRSIRQLNVSLFFEVISLIRRQGSLWDGLDFSLFGLWQF